MQANLFDVKKHNTSRNSIESFGDVKRSRLRERQHVKVFEAIRLNQPVSSRLLSQITGIERSAICRVLNDAVNTSDPLIKILYNKPCTITKKKVHYYSLIDYSEYLQIE